MTHTRSWLALGALLAALIGGTVWAAEQEKKAEKVQAPDCRDVKCVAKDNACCEDKCCAKEKGKGCCDGKCCGCCAVKNEQAPPPPPSIGVVQAFPPGLFANPTLPDGSPGVFTIAPAPQYQPAPQPAPPMPYAPVTQYVPTPQYAPPAPQDRWATARPVSNPWRLRAAVEKGRTCLEMQLSAGGEDACAYCDGMALKIGNESLKVSVADKQIQVSGSFWKGSADAVTRNTADGSILLEGHVKLKYDKEGQKAEVSAERVVVGVADGRLEVKPVEQPQTFTFWIGGGFR